MSSPSAEHACERQVDSAAYVLSALAEQELGAYTEHLAGCSICQAEVAQLQPVVDLLAVGVPPVRARRGLRAKVLGAARAEAEQREAVGGAADASASGRAGAGTHAVGGRTRSRSSAGERSTLRGLFPRRLLPGLVGALGVGVVIGGLAFSSGSSVRTEVIRAVVVAPGHHATAELRKVGSRLELVVVGMPAPPPGRIYEVWLEHGTEAPLPTDALFSVTKTGSGSVGVPGDLHGVSKVLVTDEPLGGSLKPTRTPVIVGSV
ncbi:MAG: anti-sigma factor [Solirubrobacteraceae bacterium]